MSRGKKLLIVALVLATGFGLAWPFRKTEENQPVESIAIAPQAQMDRSQFAGSSGSSSRKPQLGLPDPHVVAKMTSTGDYSSASDQPTRTATFDLAHHPALASATQPMGNATASSPVTPPVPPAPQPSRSNYRPAETQRFRGDSRPAYATTKDGRTDDTVRQRRKETRHVVQNSDTLEKLAKRYLGDENRALEIFDLNRDVLDNPHLLPINAELRIPADAKVSFD